MKTEVPTLLEILSKAVKSDKLVLINHCSYICGLYDESDSIYAITDFDLKREFLPTQIVTDAKTNDLINKSCLVACFDEYTQFMFPKTKMNVYISLSRESWFLEETDRLTLFNLFTGRQTRRVEHITYYYSIRSGEREEKYSTIKADHILMSLFTIQEEARKEKLSEEDIKLNSQLTEQYKLLDDE